jgi:osmotically-inducible protein OsmY
MNAASWIKEARLVRVLVLSTSPVGLVSASYAGMIAKVQLARPPRDHAVKRSDSRIKAQVEAALRADARLRGTSVRVRSVSDGAVLLAGTAGTMNDHLRAAGDAARVTGVQRVATEIKTRELRRSPEIDRPDKTPRSARDTWTRPAIEARVLADSPTPGLHLLNVDTHNGAVKLFGAVPPA